MVGRQRRRADSQQTYVGDFATAAQGAKADSALQPNTPITGATKTKITYDADGLVTAGADATTADIADSTNKRYVTDAQLVVIGNTSGTNTGDQTNITGNAGTATALQTARTIDGQSFNGTANITVIAPGTHAATSKATPVDADEIPLVDSAASNVLKKLTLANLKAKIKTYFDTLYEATGALRPITVGTPSSSSGTLTLDFAGKSRAVFSTTLTENVTTVTISNLPSSVYLEYEIHYKQDGTGSRTVAQPASHKALGGSDTAVASAANAVTVLSASSVDGGTTWRYAMQESA